MNLHLLQVAGDRRGNIWDGAYRKLRSERPDLIDAYEKILVKHADIKSDLSLAQKMSAVIAKELFTMMNRQWRFRIPWRHEPVLVRDLVDKVGRVLTKFQTAGSIASNADPVHVGLPFAGICVLIPLIINDSHQQQACLTGVDDITSLIGLYAEVEDEYLIKGETPATRLLAAKIENLYRHILEFLALAICQFGRSTIHRILRNIPKIDDWDGQTDNIQKSDRTCQRHIDILISNTQRLGLRAMSDVLAEHNRSIQTLLQSLHSQLDKNQKIISWVSSVAVENDQKLVRDKLGSQYWNSSRWLVDEYANWMTMRNEVTFWLCGSVGTGKSSLVSHAIEWHIKAAESKPNDRLAFFYCSRKMDKRSQPCDVLSSLVGQLTWSVDGLAVANSVRRKHEFCQSHRRLDLTIDECSDLLAGLVDLYQQTTIVIDALDECTDYTRLLLHLKKAAAASQSPLKFFLSSRQNVRVFDVLPRGKKVELDAQRDLTTEDMRNYISTQVREIESFNLGTRLLDGRYPELEDRLVEVLKGRAQGMFRWVELQLARFLGPNSNLIHPRDVINKLEKLERETGIPDLDPVYEEIYDTNTSPESHSRTVVTRVYKWMLCTQESPSLKDLTRTVSIGTDGVSDDAVNENFVLRICSNFLIADTSQVVQFAHNSVREFLEKRRINGTFEYSSISANTEVAITCLSFLSSESISQIGSISRIDGFPGYAVAYWPTHLQQSSNNRQQNPLRTLFTKFLARDNGSAFSEWIKITQRSGFAYLLQDWSQRDKLRAAASSPASPLFAACVWGFSEVITELPTMTTADSLKLNIQRKSALHIACAYGNTDTVKLLVEIADRLHIPSDAYHNPLKAAAADNNGIVVKLLLERGAHISVQDQSDKKDGGPLGAAASGGHEELFNLFLRLGADMKDYVPALKNAARGGHHRIMKVLLQEGIHVGGEKNSVGAESLESAAGSGSKEAVQLLIEKGVDVDTQTECWGSALQAAAVSGHAEVVKLLVENGANVDAGGGVWGSALSAAASQGHFDVASFLLKNGADINWQNKGEYGTSTALSKAAERSTFEGVKFLIDNAATIEPQALYNALEGGHEIMICLLLEGFTTEGLGADEYGVLLYHAASGGNEKILQLILDKGANVNVQGGRWGTPLQAATRSNHPPTVKMLLENGADPNAHGPPGDNKTYVHRSALQNAAFQGSKETVELLLSHGAKINGECSDFGTALQAAATRGNADVVQMLLDNGADINNKCGSSGSALQAAASRGKDTVLQILLDRGADVNLRGGEYDSALHAAVFAYDGYPGSNAFQILLHHGADFKTEGRRFGTTLHAAAWAGHKEAVRWLLERGVDINALGGMYGTALQAAASREPFWTISPYLAIEFANYEIVKLLLANGANVNLGGGTYGNPLQAAAYFGNVDVVRLLVENKADIKAQGGRYGTALLAAAVMGRDKEFRWSSSEAPESWYLTIMRLLSDN